MRSTSSGFTFSLTTLAAVAVIVACSPNGAKKTSITPRGSAAGEFQQKVSTCTDSLRASEKLKLGTKNKVVICEIAAGSATPTPVTYPISFSVQKDQSEKRGETSEDVRLAMTIGFQAAMTLSKEDREQFRLIFANVCGSATSEIFARSKLGSAKLHLNLGFVFNDENGDVFDDQLETSGERAPVADQSLHIVRGRQGADDFFTLDELPTRPLFYPLGKKADEIACRQKFPGRESLAQLRECARNQRAIVNAPACAAFAKRVGNLLGLVDAEKEATTCGAAQAAPVTTTSTFSKPRQSDVDFMASAELNRADLLTILSPVCPGQLKDVK